MKKLLLKKKANLININTLNIFGWHNRCKIYQLYLNNKNNKYLNNFFIFITLLQIQYKFVNHCYNLGLSWEKFYITVFMEIENKHYYYIKEFFNSIVHKKFLNNIIKFRIKNNFINYLKNYSDSFMDRNIYTKNNPKIYIKNYLFKYSNLNKNKTLLIYKKKNKVLEKIYSPFLIRNLFTIYKKNKNINYFYNIRKNKNNIFSYIINKKYKKFNNLFFFNNSIKKYKKYKLLNNNLYFNKYIQNYLDIFTKNVCNNYIENIKNMNKKYKKLNFFNKKSNKNINYFKNKKISFFYYNKLYNLYFYWYIYLYDNYLYLYNKTYLSLWLSIFFLSNKIGFYILESYIKNIFPFWKKTFNILSDYTIYKWFIIKKDLYFNMNKWFIKKITLNWIFLSKSLFIFKDYFNIFDNQKRSYKLWLLKKKKKMPLLLPFHIYQNAKFFFKKGIRYKLPIKKTKFFALFI